MSTNKVNLLNQVNGYFVGAKAAVEALTDVAEGALGYATDTDEFGSYDGSAWTWGQGGVPSGTVTFKGETNCSGNPNYPAGTPGDIYLVNTTGRIGGAAGKQVEAGDMYLCIYPRAAGAEATAGSGWTVLEHNLIGAMVGSNNLSELTNSSSARSTLGLGDVATRNVGTASGNAAAGDRGVTNGDSHDHNGGDGAQIDHVNLASKGTNTHAQIDTHLASTSNPHSVTAAQVAAIPNDGWIAGTGTWSYSSADAPVFVASVPDADAASMNIGDRWKITQTSAKYFIVVAKGSPSGGFTPITIYGGTDYTLANASITSPYYSHVKSPLGFPTSPAKWTVTVTDTSNQTQASPVQNTYYNLGSLSISAPIGLWIPTFDSIMYSDRAAAGQCATDIALSTSSSSISHPEYVRSLVVGNTTVIQPSLNLVGLPLTVAAKTTWYLVERTTQAGQANLILGGAVGTTVIRFICAYL